MALPIDRDLKRVNNEFYEHLGDRWYTAQDDPVALLRAESRARTPWVVAEIEREFPSRAPRVLDIGCGAGFLTNELVRTGFSVCGLDRSAQSLRIAVTYDATGRARYVNGDGERLPYRDRSFEAVCAMDFLEHVESPLVIVSEAARVLVSGGLFFFHTFNRNLISWLIVIKGVEWFVRNTPAAMHRLRYFVKPSELRAMCEASGMEVVCLRGLAPDFLRLAFAKMLLTGRVEEGFRFRFSRSTMTGYVGLARKSAATPPFPNAVGPVPGSHTGFQPSPARRTPIRRSQFDIKRPRT